MTVQSESVSLRTELPGRTNAYETSEVRPQVNGLIQKRFFEEGERVGAGQPLYRIDSAPYEAAVASARAALAQAQATIASTAAQARRYGELVEINAISRQEAENAQAAAAQARASVAAQQAALRSAQIDLARTTIRAPIAGRVNRSTYTVGALVSAGQADALTTIQRLDPIYVDIQQSSADLLRLRKQIMNGDISRDGGDARVQLRLEDGSIYPETGTLKFTEVSVDPATGSQVVRAVFPNRQGLLMPGMYVRAELVQGTKRDALVVPQQAVSRDEKGRPVVLVVDKQGKVAQRVIETPQTVGNNWLVSKGLKAGERIIVEGQQNARPGTTVKPVAMKGVPGKEQASAGGKPAGEQAASPSQGEGR